MWQVFYFVNDRWKYYYTYHTFEEAQAATARLIGRGILTDIVDVSDTFW